METNNGPVEENTAIKDSQLFLQISEIYIELPATPMQIDETGTCQHSFSMRGYTLGRRNNQKTSMLFPSDGNPIDSEELPPMEVQTSRWWRCPECIRTIYSASGTILPETLQAPATVNADRIQTVDANLTSNRDTVEGASSLSNPWKTKNAKSGAVAAIGETNESSEQLTDTAGKNKDGAVEIGDEILSSHDCLPAPQMSTDASEFSIPSKLQKYADSSEHGIPPETTNITAVECGADGFSGKPDTSESGQCRENEHSTGISRRKARKVRLLADLLGDKSSSKGGRRENNPCAHSVLIESTGFEVQVDPCKDVPDNLRSPLRKTRVTQEEEESNGPRNVPTYMKAPRRDTGKAIMVAEVPNSDAEVNAFAAEGLFIGTKTERSRRRGDNTPALGRRKNKQPQVLDFTPALPNLTGSIQAPSATGSWENHQPLNQTDWDHADIVPEALKSVPSDNSSVKAGFDLSLNSFVKKIDTVNPSSASKEVEKNDGMLFRKSHTFPATESDGSGRKGPLWDLNVKAAHNSYNLEKGNHPPQKEMEFFNLGLHDKISEVQGNLRETDQRADDIPMDIVELLARKQYERRKGYIDIGSADHLTTNKSSFLEPEEIRTVEQFAKQFPSFPSFRSFNAQNGTSMARDSTDAADQNPVSFSNIGRNHLNMVHGGENRPKSIFTAFAQNQPNLYSGTHIPAPASMTPGLQCRDMVEPLLLSSTAKMPLGFSIQHKLAAEHHKGKTISDIKEDEVRKTEESRLVFPNPGGTMLNSKAQGALDPYANESIPAMHLLSLMDGRSPRAAFNLGPSKIIEKPFAPCSFHPRFSTNERQDILNGSFFSHQCHPKEASGLGAAFSDSYQSSRQLSAVLSGQISFRPKEQEKLDKSQKNKTGTSAGPSSSRGKEKQKVNLHAATSILCPQNNHRFADSRRFNLEANSISGVRPNRNMSSEGLCSINRNPADFSIPEARNKYTICARDLKFQKRNLSRERPASIKVNGAKRQRVSKAKPGSDVQNRSS